ncbi:MAG: autotransporter-associated beta strand repeat-containing protein, partial [Planctomycetia bacterium]
DAFLGWGGSGVGTATVSSGSWANSSDLNVGVNGTGTLTIDGGLVSVGGTLSRGSAGTINLNAGGTLQIGTGGTAGGLGVSTLVNDGTLVFNRSDDSAYSGVVSGSGAVVKQGGGALILSGNNTYSGATTVVAGALVINGSLANSAVTVGNGGMLGGNGSIGGLVTVQSGGVLSPGNSPGLLSAGVLDLLAGSTSLMQIVGDGSGGAGTAGTGYDSLTIATSGGLSYGGSLDLEFGNGTAFLDDTFFDLFAFSGSPAGHFGSVFTSGTGLYGGASLSGTGGIWTTVIGEQRLTFSELTGRLSFTAVPEIDPATGGSVLSLVTGMLALLEQRRRRHTSPR